MEQNNYGHVTVATGSPNEREIAITDFVQAVFSDNRIVSISTLENDEGYILAVENIKSSGREATASMWLTEESFMGLTGTAILFWNCKGTDLEKMIEKATIDKKIKYRASDNLKGFPHGNQQD